MPPQRIVSLVPSLTELLFVLGAGDALVGRTRFCEEPRDVIDSVPVIGGTKTPSVERVFALAPDLVIANKEENRREDIEAMRAFGLEVLLTDPNTVEEAATMVEEIGRIVGAPAAAAAIARETRKALGDQRPAAAMRVLVPIWWNPLMALGSGAYGHDLLERAGFTNVLRDRPRYPELSMGEARALDPRIILLPDEPFPFNDGHVADFSAIAPARIIDGKLLWWYGSRMPAAIRTLRLIRDEVARV